MVRFRYRPSRRVRVLVWRARRPVIVLVTLLIAVLVYRELTRPPADLVPVLVTSEAVPAGTELTSALTATALLPADHVPDDAVMSLAELTTRTTAVEIPAGLPVVPQLLARPVGGIDLAPGLVVAPLTLADQVFAALLSVGDRLAVYDQGGSPLATSALVVRVQAATTSSLLPVSSQITVLVAVTEAEAVDLAIAGEFVLAVLTS